MEDRPGVRLDGRGGPFPRRVPRPSSADRAVGRVSSVRWRRGPAVTVRRLRWWVRVTRCCGSPGESPVPFPVGADVPQLGHRRRAQGGWLTRMPDGRSPSARGRGRRPASAVDTAPNSAPASQVRTATAPPGASTAVGAGGRRASRPSDGCRVVDVHARFSLQWGWARAARGLLALTRMMDDDPRQTGHQFQRRHCAPRRVPCQPLPQPSRQPQEFQQGEPPPALTGSARVCLPCSPHPTETARPLDRTPSVGRSPDGIAGPAAALLSRRSPPPGGSRAPDR